MNYLDEINITASRKDDYQISEQDLDNLQASLQDLLAEPELPNGIVAVRAYTIADDLIAETI